MVASYFLNKLLRFVQTLLGTSREYVVKILQYNDLSIQNDNFLIFLFDIILYVLGAARIDLYY